MKLTTALYCVFVSAAMLLGGCAGDRTLTDGFAVPESSAKVLVTYGTFKAIEKGQTAEEQRARAVKIRTIATQARELASGDGVLFDALKAAIAGEVVKLKLEPADQYLAGVLVDMVFAEIEARVCNPDAPTTTQLCSIAPDHVYVVTEVLDWVIDATTIYAGPAA